jgi:nitrate/nitrite-specific signal transduction histidine kinase
LLPETTIRRQILVFAIVLALMTIVVFGWLWILVLRPLLRLQGEAERLAYGDLSRNVEVIRYDEIGLIARALERIRILLIRQRVQRGKRPPQSKPPREEEG